MDSPFIPARITADGNGETRCVIFVREIEEARRAIEKHESRIVAQFPFISAVGAYVNVHRVSDLSSLPQVEAVSVSPTVTACMDKARPAVGADVLHRAGLSGKGVTAAVIDTGIAPHADFCIPRNRIKVFKDFIGGYSVPYDDNGHGTAVCGILAGNGLISGGRYRGVAYKADLAVLKAIGRDGEGNAFNILEAMQWVFSNRDKYNIRVLCMSLGSVPLPKSDPLILGAEALWRSGVAVVASAGNGGPGRGTVLSPAASPVIISVGGAQLEDGKISVPDFSSRGPGMGFSRPDIIAPAKGITSVSGEGGYKSMSGTSMAAPIAAGLAALISQLVPDAAPDRIKELLLSHALPVESDENVSGKGLVTSDFITEFPYALERLKNKSAENADL